MKTRLEMLTELRDELNWTIEHIDLTPECTGIAFLSTADGGRSCTTLLLNDPSLEAAYKHMAETYSYHEPRKEVTCLKPG